jgi:hypothetical protein
MKLPTSIVNPSRSIPFFLVFTVSIACILYYGTLPVGGDSDLWWHMAIGKDFVAQGTLIPDHGVYTWTDVNVDHPIYNAWLAQISFFWIYEHAGSEGLQLTRYLLTGAPLLMLFAVAWITRVLWHPLIWIVPLACFLPVTQTALLLKPESFSYCFFLVTCALWVTVKQNDKASCLVWLFPAIMLIWVNSHGVWIFGALFLVLFTLGEWLNPLIGYHKSWSAKRRWNWTFAMVISAASALCNPYGWHYPMDLFKTFVGANAFSETTTDLFKVVPAFDNIFSKQVAPSLVLSWYLFMVACIGSTLWLTQEERFRKMKAAIGAYWLLLIPQLGLMLLDPFRNSGWVNDGSVFVFLTAGLVLCGIGIAQRFHSRCLDLGWLLPVVVLGIYSTIHFRSIYYGIIPGFVGLMLLAPRSHGQFQKTSPIIRLLPASVSIGCIIVCSIILHRHYHYEKTHNWTGWGLDDYCPAREASYFLEHFPDVSTVGNELDLGGYLIFKFQQRTKVMIDSRIFPFIHWIPEYIDWTNGKNLSFAEEHPADVWFLLNRHHVPFLWFLHHPEFQLEAIGPVASIFVRKEIATNKQGPVLLKAEGFIRSPARAMDLAQTSMWIGHWKAFQWAMESLASQAGHRSRLTFEALENRIRGRFALQIGDYQQAATLLVESLRPKFLAQDDALVEALLYLGSEHFFSERLEAASECFSNARLFAPSDPRLLACESITAIHRSTMTEWGNDRHTRSLCQALANIPRSSNDPKWLTDSANHATAFLNDPHHQPGSIPDFRPEPQVLSEGQQELVRWLDAQGREALP